MNWKSAIRSALTMCCGVFVLGCAWITPGVEARAAEALAPVAMAVPDEKFFADHPDLIDEREAAEAASQELAAEGSPAADDLNAREILAARTRQILSQRTSVEWQKKAISLYPELGVAGSEFNALFLQHHRDLQNSTPAFEQEASWPVLLAKRCADEIRARKSATAASQPQPPLPATIDAPSKVSSPQKAVGSVGLIVTGAVLITAALFPGLLLFRGVAARQSADCIPGSRASSPWYRAVKPAIVIYGVAAIAAVIRSLPANGDLSLTNRCFITLCVSIIFGGFAGVVGYLFALLYCALHPRDGRPHAHSH